MSEARAAGVVVDTMVISWLQAGRGRAATA